MPGLQVSDVEHSVLPENRQLELGEDSTAPLGRTCQEERARRHKFHTALGWVSWTSTVLTGMGSLQKLCYVLPHLFSGSGSTGSLIPQREVIGLHHQGFGEIWTCPCWPVLF